MQALTNQIGALQDSLLKVSRQQDSMDRAMNAFIVRAESFFTQFPAITAQADSFTKALEVISQFVQTTLMVSHHHGKYASPLHLSERVFTFTEVKLSKTFDFTPFLIFLRNGTDRTTLFCTFLSITRQLVTQSLASMMTWIWNT
ncbi:MAG: hypothetical protein AB1489_41370 [Acidobacteriota bacterium]